MTCQIKESSFHFKIMYNKPNIINLKKEIFLGVFKAKILSNYFCLKEKIPKHFFYYSQGSVYLCTKFGTGSLLGEIFRKMSFFQRLFLGIFR